MSGLTDKVRARPVAVLMVGAIPVMLGIVAFLRLPVALMPEVESPALSVEVGYPGVGPEKIEEIITRPLEESLSTVGGIEQLFSTSEEGKSKINIEFDRGVDLNRRALAVRDRVDPVIAGFPREVQPPIILRYDPSRRPIMIITLESASLGLAELREFADLEVKKALESVNGVGEVAVAGGKEREIQIACDKTALEAHGLGLDEVLRAVREFNVNRFAGNLADGRGKIGLYTRGRYRDLEQIRQVPLKHQDTRVVRLEHVAAVKQSFRDVDSASRLNGQEKVSLYVYRAGKASLPALADEARARLRHLQKPDRHFSVRYDRAESIVTAFQYMGLALLFSFLLAGLCLRAVFRMHAGEILAALSALPAAALMTTFVLFLADSQFDLVTVSGLILGAGPALFIAVLQILELREPGGGRTDAGRVILLLAIAGFVPVIFAGPDVRVVYGGIALALICEITAALFWTALVLPVLLLYFPEFPVRLPAPIERGGQAARDFLDRRLPAELERGTRLALQHPRIALLICLVVLAGAVLAFRYSRFEFINVFDTRTLTGNLEFPSGTAFGVTNSVSKKIEAALQKAEDVVEITSRVEADKSTLRLKLDRDVDEDYLDELKAAAGKTDPAFLYFSSDEGASGALEEIRIEVFGDDLVTLDNITRSLAKRSEALEGVHDVVLRYKSPRPEMRLMVDRIRAETSGVNATTIGDNVRIAIQGGVATRFVEPNREVDMRVRYDERWRRSLERLKEFGIKRKDGRFVPLFELVRPEEGKVPPKIYRKNKKRSLSFSLKARGTSMETLLDRLDALKQARLPEGYRIEFGEDVYRHLRERRRLYLILGLGSLLIYMVLAGLLESLRRPFFLLLFMPLPGALCVLFLFIAGMAISVPALIGLFLMTAFVVLQSIWLEAAPPEKWGREISAFADLALLVGLFYLPLCLIPAQGGEIIRAVAFTLIVGPITATLLTPALFHFLKSADSSMWKFYP